MLDNAISMDTPPADIAVLSLRLKSDLMTFVSWKPPTKSSDQSSTLNAIFATLFTRYPTKRMSKGNSSRLVNSLFSSGVELCTSLWLPAHLQFHHYYSVLQELARSTLHQLRLMSVILPHSRTATSPLSIHSHSLHRHFNLADHQCQLLL